MPGGRCVAAAVDLVDEPTDTRPDRTEPDVLAAYDRSFSLFGKARVEHKVARFRQVNVDDPHVHHDALEFPGGQIVMVTRLMPGQRASVLQLPASGSEYHGGKEATPARQRSFEPAAL